MNGISHIREFHCETEGLREAVTITGETRAQALIQNQESLDIPQGGQHVESPCHLAKLPKEVRLEIWRYVIQQRFGESFVLDLERDCIRTEAYVITEYPIRLCELFLTFNRELYEEIKDVFFDITTFVILVDAKRAQHSAYNSWHEITTNHGTRDKDDNIRFISPWATIRNYSVRITLRPGIAECDLIREYISYITYEVLAKTPRLRNLHVSVEISMRTRKTYTDKIKLVIGPLHRLRCIPKPRLVGIYPRCPEPRDEVYRKVFKGFDAVVREWEHCVAAEAPFRVLPKSPTYELFIEFKALYKTLVDAVPFFTSPKQRSSLLHRAADAREQEDIVAFRKQFARLLSFARTESARGTDRRREVESAAQRITEMMTHIEETGPPQHGQVDTVRPC